MNDYRLLAPCIFGLEKPVADELKDMGADSVSAENGRVFFCGGDEMIARANIGSRYSERIQICVGEFEARSFTELFDNVKALEWERYIGAKDAFPVKGWSINSTLFSTSDCQSIIKKAIVDRLSSRYGITWFEETGAPRSVCFSILKDKVTMTIDTTGSGLHKRGYRKNANDAPLKETIAAAMVKLSRIYDDTNLYDPFCGSGTIPIEAAMLARNIAPGLRRSFAAEEFGFISGRAWSDERMRAQDLIKHNIPFKVFASDIDKDCVDLTLANANKAGVGDCVTAKKADVADFAPATERGIIVTNPPYGERLLDIDTAQEIYRAMGKAFEQKRGYRYTVISSHDEFEEYFGRPADKRRKVYNGNIKCQIFMYFK